MRLPVSIDRHLGALRLVLASLAGGGVARRLRRAWRRRDRTGRPGITGSTGTVKVAVLLPISSSGSTPAVAKALKQAAELALFDFDNPNVTLIPKDTKGSPEGARTAAESALHDGAELIIGPLFAAEVSAAAPVALPRRRADDRLLQRRESRRQRRLSLELPGGPRRAAHRLLSPWRRVSAISPS